MIEVKISNVIYWYLYGDQIHPLVLENFWENTFLTSQLGKDFTNNLEFCWLLMMNTIIVKIVSLFFANFRQQFVWMTVCDN